MAGCRRWRAAGGQGRESPISDEVRARSVGSHREAILLSVSAVVERVDGERGLHRSRLEVDDVHRAPVRRGVRGGARAVDHDVARSGPRRQRRQLGVRALRAEAIEPGRTGHVTHSVRPDGDADVPRIERDPVRHTARGMGLARGGVGCRVIRACGQDSEDRERGQRKKTRMHGDFREGRKNQAGRRRLRRARAPQERRSRQRRRTHRPAEIIG